MRQRTYSFLRARAEAAEVIAFGRRYIAIATRRKEDHPKMAAENHARSVVRSRSRCPSPPRRGSLPASRNQRPERRLASMFMF